MKKPEKCISCGKRLVESGSTTFPCPQCGKLIGRCRSCREASAVFVCECGYEGP
ncbi:MAG TPA: DUF1610 domain-containing protein [Thermoplasmata archaeon]|nr:DUF1610 domain-containing protein [Thermoplasmata archaeon]HIH98375.1 DUF1610 domain-containing protein [Thermoplasmata archaeon]